jgi:hypothetical protein
MKATVGTVVRLKKDCLGCKAGTLGVGFYDYGNGTQIIFSNGDYDGFSCDKADSMFPDSLTEQDALLEYIRTEPTLTNYKFKNVIQVSRDFDAGVFAKGFKE